MESYEGRASWLNQFLPAATSPSGTYRCTSCGETIDVGSTTHLPPCPNCGNGEWQSQSGGDSVNDPYPNG